MHGPGFARTRDFLPRVQRAYYAVNTFLRERDTLKISHLPWTQIDFASFKTSMYLGIRPQWVALIGTYWCKMFCLPAKIMWLNELVEHLSYLSLSAVILDSMEGGCITIQTVKKLVYSNTITANLLSNTLSFIANLRAERTRKINTTLEWRKNERKKEGKCMVTIE